MPVKAAQPLSARFPRASPAALKLLAKLLSFDPARRATAEEALTDPYFAGLHDPAREPVAEPISRREFEFEKRKLSVEEVRDLEELKTSFEEYQRDSQGEMDEQRGKLEQEKSALQAERIRTMGERTHLDEKESRLGE